MEGGEGGERREGEEAGEWSVLGHVLVDHFPNLFEVLTQSLYLVHERSMLSCRLLL